jgi:hypothetical protein
MIAGGDGEGIPIGVLLVWGEVEIGGKHGND